MSGTFAFHNIYTTKNEVENIQTVLHEGNESGEGTMRRFEVAPGIQITYNDLKMDSCFRPIRFEKDFLQINHCLEGCYECELAGRRFSQLFWVKATFAWITSPKINRCSLVPGSL